MAIPTGELELHDLDPQNLTLDELALMFDPASLSEGEVVSIFRQFCLRHTNWGRRAIGGIMASEMQAVMGKISEAVQALAVPKEIPPV